MTTQIQNLGSLIGRIDKRGNMTTALATQQDLSTIESVIAKGDLAKLTPQERLNYYQALCKSLGLNSLTKPFEYITLNGKLTLYARKDATDQLRKLHCVSIEKPDIQQIDDLIIVTVSARDKSGRSDSDIGVVKKTDMQGNLANNLMKAVTKAKRRVTLSICGLGLLDETELETIPDAKPFVETNPLDEALKTVCNELNSSGDSIVWKPQSLRDYASELFDQEILNSFSLDDEQKQILVDDLNQRLAERKALQSESIVIDEDE